MRSHALSYLYIALMDPLDGLSGLTEVRLDLPGTSDVQLMTTSRSTGRPATRS